MGLQEIMKEKENRLRQTGEDQYLLSLTQDLYRIPTLQEVRKIEELEGMTQGYSDGAINAGLELVKYFLLYHQFLVKENYGSYISYNMPGTFIFKPLAIYLQDCYDSGNTEEVKNILIYLADSYSPNPHDESLDLIMEGFIDGNAFDNKDFRGKLISDFPEGSLKEYIKERFQNIYPQDN